MGWIDTGFTPAQPPGGFTGYTARCGGVGRLAVPARWGGGLFKRIGASELVSSPAGALRHSAVAHPYALGELSVAFRVVRHWALVPVSVLDPLAPHVPRPAAADNVSVLWVGSEIHDLVSLLSVAAVSLAAYALLYHISYGLSIGKSANFRRILKLV